MQYSKVVKIGYILFLMPKVDIIEWTEFSTRLLKAMLGSKVMFTLVILKINDSRIFKDNNKKQGSLVVKVRMSDSIAVYVETIKK